jgi:hypothetical protein
MMTREQIKVGIQIAVRVAELRRLAARTARDCEADSAADNSLLAMPIWIAFLCVMQLIVSMHIHILRGLMITMLTLVVSNGVAFAGPLENAEAAYKRHDYGTALRLMMPLAEQGNAHAQSYTGFMYANGQGVRGNDKEAVKWYRLAAEQGDVQGESNLGRVYANGLGVPRDYNEAVKGFGSLLPKEMRRRRTLSDLCTHMGKVFQRTMYSRLCGLLLAKQ